MLTIRLQRTGKKNQADFRIVLAEKHKPVNRKYLEILGSFNPRKKVFKVKSEERVKELIAQNTNISPTVHNLFVSNSLLEGKKVQAFKVKKKEEKPAADKSTEEKKESADSAKPSDDKKPEEPKTEDKPKEPKPEEKKEPAAAPKPEAKKEPAASDSPEKKAETR